MNTATLRAKILPIMQINAALPKQGIVYEIGCGWGSLAYEIALAGLKRTVVGIDTDQQKIRQAEQKFQLKNLSYVVATAERFSYQNCTGVVLSDFLHHVPYELQLRIIKKVSTRIVTNGVLIIKEIHSGDRVRSLLSRIWDWVLYPHDPIYYREKNELRAALTKMGFAVTVTETVKWFPGSTWLFICRKK